MTSVEFKIKDRSDFLSEIIMLVNTAKILAKISHLDTGLKFCYADKLSLQKQIELIEKMLEELFSKIVDEKIDEENISEALTMTPGARIIAQNILNDEATNYIRAGQSLQKQIEVISDLLNLQFDEWEHPKLLKV